MNVRDTGHEGFFITDTYLPAEASRDGGLELGVALVGSAIPAPHASVDAVPSAVFLSLAHAARRLRLVCEAASASA